MRFSCIIPVYNSEKFLEKCISGVLSQTFSDFELILVNDGSTDSSYSICLSYAEKDSRIICLTKSNGGGASARNAALDIAQGEYVVFVDSDDRIAPDYFEHLDNCISLSGADLVITSAGSFWESSECKPLPDAVYTKEEYLHKAFFEFEYITVFSQCYKAIRREILEKNGVRFPQEYLLSEDRIFSLRVLCYANKVSTTSYAGYFYDNNPDSLTHKRKNSDVLRRIICAEADVWNTADELIDHIEDASGEIKKYVCDQRKKAFLAMDSYIVKSDADIKKRRELRKAALAILPVEKLEVVVPENSLVWRVFKKAVRRAAAKDKTALLVIWLMCMRAKQKIK